MDNFGHRLKTERQRLGLSQERMGKIAGVTKQSQINYEKGLRQPDAQYLAAIARDGVDINFVITGEKTIKKDILAIAIAAVEEGLSSAINPISPSKKAELVLAAYDLINEPEMPLAKVVQLVKVSA